MPPEIWEEGPLLGEPVPPMVQLSALMTMRPMGSVGRQEQMEKRSWRGNAVACPVGQSYYDVVVVKIDEECEVAKATGTSAVIFCKEQILDWTAGGHIEGWPTAALTLEGFQSGARGSVNDPRDEAPETEWVTIKMEEEIDAAVSNLRRDLGRSIDMGVPQTSPTSRLSTISEHASASDPSPRQTGS